MNKTMVIIKSSASAVVTIENFLRNREWNIISTTDIKEATHFITQYKPEFVLISVDHHNPKILMLPEILSQHFPVITMVFAEKSTAASYHSLQSIKADYHLNPPLTGPAVERAVNKYLKKLESLKKQNKSSKPPNYSEQVEKSYSKENISKALSEITETSAWIPSSENKTFQLNVNQQGHELKNASQDVLNKLSDKSSLSFKIDEITEASCLLIQSKKFSGYLIVAMAKNRKIDSYLLNHIKTNLIDFLKNNGDELNDNSAFDLKLKKVKFEPWAKEYAEFLKKSVIRGEEIAMAFFPYAEVKAKLFDSFNHEMVAIKINDIETDKPVAIDLYIYLPTNKKYILYTPKGGVFYESQKNRLIQQGISELHLKANETHELDKSRAENYLNHTVEEFSKKTGSKVA